MENALLKANEVCGVLGLSRAKVYDLMARGTLPVVRIGRAVRVPRAALEKWILDHTAVSEHTP
jgi:excisionase family DNA binding protein